MTQKPAAASAAIMAPSLSLSWILLVAVLAVPGTMPEALAQADERASHPIEQPDSGIPESGVERGRMGAMVTPIEILPFRSPAEERRYRALISEMRCTVCQNESLVESTAPLARDKRLLVLRLLQEGQNDAQIRQFMVDRYGYFVLYRPPFTSHTMLLWVGPFLLMFGALIATFIIINKRRQALQ